MKFNLIITYYNGRSFDTIYNLTFASFMDCVQVALDVFYTLVNQENATAVIHTDIGNLTYSYDITHSVLQRLAHQKTGRFTDIRWDNNVTVFVNSRSTEEIPVNLIIRRDEVDNLRALNHSVQWIRLFAKQLPKEDDTVKVHIDEICQTLKKLVNQLPTEN